jgi:hypothetical protein
MHQQISDIMEVVEQCACQGAPGSLDFGLHGLTAMAPEPVLA